MLNNKADLIEKYILDMLAEGGVGKVELKRTDLADEVSCAPSQVSYVLSTRFTNAKGFQVESQRGLGGYIRITVIEDTEQEKKSFYRELIEAFSHDELTLEQATIFLEVVKNYGYITEREEKILKRQFEAYYALGDNDYMSEEVRQFLVQNIFKILSELT